MWLRAVQSWLMVSVLSGRVGLGKSSHAVSLRLWGLLQINIRAPAWFYVRLWVLSCGVLDFVRACRRMNGVRVQQSSAHPDGSCGSCPATPAWASSRLWCPPADARGGSGDAVGVASVYGPTPDETYTRVSAGIVITMTTEGVHLTLNIYEKFVFFNDFV